MGARQSSMEDIEASKRHTMSHPPEKIPSGTPSPIKEEKKQEKKDKVFFVSLVFASLIDFCFNSINSS